ncbi:MAG: DUF3667 domain-containing protein [Bacteroidota bacterium]
MQTCKTCGSEVAEQANFCPHCGAKQVRGRLTIAALLQNLFSRLVAFDFAFIRTTTRLILRPDEVTLGYIDGARKRYNPPIQYALIGLSMYGIFQFYFSDFLDLTLEKNFLSGFNAGFNNYEGSPEAELRKQKVTSLINWVQSRNQFLIFTMIPFMGIFANLLYRKRGYNLAEHMVVSIYAASFSLISGVFLGLMLAPFGGLKVAELYIQGTFFLTLGGMIWIYMRSMKGLFIKPLLVLGLSFFCTFVVLIFVLIALTL